MESSGSPHLTLLPRELEARLTPEELAGLARRLRYAERWRGRAPPNTMENIPAAWWRTPLDAEEVARWWHALLERRGSAGAPELIQFYAHVPFCRTKCSFCHCSSLVSSSAAQVERYLVAFEREAAELAGRLGPVRVQSATVGGGTPSLLSAAQLGRVLDAVVGRVVTLTPESYFSVEFNPDSTTSEKVSLLVEHGVRRLSLGVQSFHAPTLHAVARGYQDAAMVHEAVRLARGAGLMVALDLIAPLVLETPASFEAGVLEALGLRPDQLVLYRYQPVQRGQRLIAPGELSFEAAARCFRARAGEAGYELAVDGYSSLVAQLPEAQRSWVHYAQHRPEPCSLLGVGPFAESYVFGVGSYTGLPLEDGRVAYTGARWDLDTERSSTLGRCIALDGQVARAPWRAAFGEEPEAYHPEVWAYLEALGVARSTAEGVTFTEPEPVQRYRRAWLFIDAARRRLLRGRWVEATLRPALREAAPLLASGAAAWAQLEALVGGEGALALEGAQHAWQLTAAGEVRSVLEGRLGSGEDHRAGDSPPGVAELRALAGSVATAWPEPVAEQLAALVLTAGLEPTLRLVGAGQRVAWELLLPAGALSAARLRALLGPEEARLSRRQGLGELGWRLSSARVSVTPRWAARPRGEATARLLGAWLDGRLASLLSEARRVTYEAQGESRYVLEFTELGARATLEQLTAALPEWQRAPRPAPAGEALEVRAVRVPIEGGAARWRAVTLEVLPTARGERPVPR